MGVLLLDFLFFLATSLVLIQSGKRFVMARIQQHLRDKRSAVFIYLRQNIPEFWLALFAEQVRVDSSASLQS